ncbi:hypothetical protein Leryth_013091 [Lithospermum erythrorhizon]|nr:hypothetical protein Leryth_013091 [Lithospermum erythrorhizon]
MSKRLSGDTQVEHYACMVDLLGRAGRLSDAMKLVEDMPMDPTPIVWVAPVLAAYSNALTLENMQQQTRIRSLMKNSGIRKRPGCSWVQGKKGTAMFYVGDRSHPISNDIYNLLTDLIDKIKVLGYVPETSYALHDVDDEEKGDLLFEHSEKLALAYGLLTTAPGVPIRIIKNLRRFQCSLDMVSYAMISLLLVPTAGCFIDSQKSFALKRPPSNIRC